MLVDVCKMLSLYRQLSSLSYVHRYRVILVIVVDAVVAAVADSA